MQWISEDGAPPKKKKRRVFPFVIDGPEDDDPRRPSEQPVPVSRWQPRVLTPAWQAGSHVPSAPPAPRIHGPLPQYDVIQENPWQFISRAQGDYQDQLKANLGFISSGIANVLPNSIMAQKKREIAARPGLTQRERNMALWGETKKPSLEAPFSVNLPVVGNWRPSIGVAGALEIGTDPATPLPLPVVDNFAGKVLGDVLGGAKVTAGQVKQAAPVVGEALQGITEQGRRSVTQPFAPELGFAAGKKTGKAKKPVKKIVQTETPKVVNRAPEPPTFSVPTVGPAINPRRERFSELLKRLDTLESEGNKLGYGSEVVRAYERGTLKPSEAITLMNDMGLNPDLDYWRGKVKPSVSDVPTPRLSDAEIDSLVSSVADAPATGVQTVPPSVPKAVSAKEPVVEARTGEQMKQLRKELFQGKLGFEVPKDDFIKAEAKVLGEQADHPWVIESLTDTHKNLVRQAIKVGESVPPEVLKDYPDLIAKVDVPKSVETPKPVSPAVEPVTSQAPAPAPVVPPASGGVPPVEPPKPVAVNPDDVARRFVEVINDPANLKISAADKAFKSQQMAAKAAKFMDNFTALRESGMAVEEAANKATAQLSGKLERKTMTLGDLFSPEERKALFNMVEQKSAGVPVLETKSRISALTKALDEGVITDVKGVAGGSQRTRLEAVFGKPFVEAMDTASKKLQGTGRGQYVGGGKPLVPEVGRQGGLADIGDFVPTLEPQYAMGNKPPAPFAPMELSVGEQLKQAAFFNEGHVADFPNFPEGSVGKQLAILPPTAREQAMSALKRIGVEAVDTLNVPRAFITAFDVSAPGRQGLQLLVAHPVSGYKNLGKMFKALASEKSAKASAEQVDSIIRRAGERARRLYIAPTELKPGLSGLSQGEESYMSRLAFKIPGVKRSQRAYVTFLNGMRADVFNQGMKAMEQLPIVELKDYDALSNLINAASGRGDLPNVLKNSSPVLNALMFSPRLVMARLEYVPRIVQAYATGNPVLAKEATRQLVTFLGFGASVIGLYKLAGGKVEGDPRSADFGKVTIGNSHVDIWGGYLQYSRVLARMATSSTKVNGKVRPQTLGTTLGDFAQSKFSPITSLFWDIGTGKDYSYNPMTASVDTLKTQSFNRLVPLFAQDLIEAIKLDGTATGLGMGALSGFGVGVTTYKKPEDSLQYNTGGTRFPVIPQTVPQTTPPTSGGFKFQKKKVTK